MPTTQKAISRPASSCGRRGFRRGFSAGGGRARSSVISARWVMAPSSAIGRAAHVQHGQALQYQVASHAQGSGQRPAGGQQGVDERVDQCPVRQAGRQQRQLGGVTAPHALHKRLCSASATGVKNGGFHGDVRHAGSRPRIRAAPGAWAVPVRHALERSFRLVCVPVSAFFPLFDASLWRAVAPVLARFAPARAAAGGAAAGAPGWWCTGRFCRAWTACVRGWSERPRRCWGCPCASAASRPNPAAGCRRLSCATCSCWTAPAPAREALRLPRVSAVLSVQSLLVWEPRFAQLLIDAPGSRSGATARAASSSPGWTSKAPRRRRPVVPEMPGRDWFFSQPELWVRNGRLRWLDERRAAQHDSPPAAAGAGRRQPAAAQWPAAPPVPAGRHAACGLGRALPACAASSASSSSSARATSATGGADCSWTCRAPTCASCAAMWTCPSTCAGRWRRCAPGSMCRPVSPPPPRWTWACVPCACACWTAPRAAAERDRGPRRAFARQDKLSLQARRLGFVSGDGIVWPRSDWGVSLQMAPPRARPAPRCWAARSMPSGSTLP